MLKDKLPNMKNPRAILIAAAIVLAAFLVFRGVLGSSTPAHKQDVPPVIVASAQTQDVPVYDQAVGTVLANATVQVKSRIDGQIVGAGFKEGQLVKKGDLLFEIDRAPYEAALRAAEANLQRDQAQLANAMRDLDRANKLVAKGYVSTQARDTAQAQAKALAGSVGADNAAVDQAKLQLGYTDIRSPIDGKTGPLLIDVGNIIKAADANPLVVVTQIQPVKISFSLAQQYLPALQARLAEKTLTASFKPRDAKDEVSAPVDFIGNAVNAGAGTIELRATYDNGDLRLVPGEFVDVRVLIDNLPNAVTVPREAVNTGQDSLYVYVITPENKAEMRKVTVLHRTNGIAALAPGAVKPGEKVVVEGQMRVAPGMTVKIVTREPAA